MRLDAWKYRRKFMVVQTMFCKLVIGYVILSDMRGEVAEAALTMAFVLLGAIVTSYVFGAVMDDRNKTMSNDVDETSEEK